MAIGNRLDDEQLLSFKQQDIEKLQKEISDLKEAARDDIRVIQAEDQWQEVRRIREKLEDLL